MEHPGPAPTTPTSVGASPCPPPARPLTVSVVVPVRDEIDRIAQVIAAIESQTFQPDEVVVVDGCSADGTAAWCREAASTRPWLRLVDNPQRTVPAALNIGLRAATGDIWARMDAHADYPPDYLASAVALLRTRPDVAAVGSLMTTAGVGTWGRAVAAVLSRPVGLGGARHRIDGASGPIGHVFTGAYRRQRLIEAGGYDERLLANEDFEADYRLRAAGATLWLDRSLTSIWYVRESLPALARQMWRYGYYKSLTLTLHPRSLRPRQLVPPSLVLALAGTAVTRPRWSAALAASYLALSGAVGARAAVQDGASGLQGAVALPVVHLCWGAGLVVGGLGHLARFGRLRPVEGPLPPAMTAAAARWRPRSGAA